MKKFLIAGLAALACMALNPGIPHAQEMINQVLAVVGDEVVTSQDLKKMMSRMQSALQSVRTAEEKAQREKSLKKLALDTLIEERLILAEAKKQGIRVGQRDVDSYINRIKMQNKLSDQAFAAQLSRQGIAIDEYREGLRNDLLKRRVITRAVFSQVVISDEQVMQYLKEEGRGPVETDNVTIRALFLKIPTDAQPQALELIKKRAEELRAQAMAKGNMAELADKNSQGPGAGQGGKLGPLDVIDLLPPMRQALIGLKKNQFSQVIEVPGSMVFMQLLDRSHTTKTVDATETAQVRSKLEKEARANKLKEWIDELRKAAYVKIMKNG
jgi:peptidyl-prolyl cis-trans isomerase SurA